MTSKIDILAPLEQEGTKAVVRDWLKQIGDRVSEGDALVELETDKVTQEVPAPCDGILTDINMQNGDDAAPGSILGRMTPQNTASDAFNDPDMPHGVPLTPSLSGTDHYSPAVRQAAAEYEINPSTVQGSGKGGRVTRADMDHAHEVKGMEKPSTTSENFGDGVATLPSETSVTGRPSVSAQSRRIPHSTMRLAIANHMSHSLAIAPQVTAVFEADFSAVKRHRDLNKSQMKSEGINLSYTVYLVSACVAAMKAVPEVNSRWHEDNLEIFEDINIGIGIALGDKGLVAPVIRRAQTLSLRETATRLQDLTDRARTSSLTGEDLKGGTFTISNHGVSGSLLAAPIIINQPQSAILGVGKLEKRVVIREVDGVDAIQIRPMAYVSLTIDHRALDGYQTNTWLTEFVKTLESWPL